jgi:hypothetical protein
MVLIAVCWLAGGCASDDDVPGENRASVPPADECLDIAPREYRFTSPGYSELPVTIRLEVSTSAQPDSPCAGEMEPHLSQPHPFHDVARWRLTSDGILRLEWSNQDSGIYAELKRTSPRVWEGVVEERWSFPTRGRPQYPARLECAPRGNELLGIAPRKYRFTANADLPEALWLEAPAGPRTEWPFVGEMQPHLPESHMFHKVAGWSLQSDGTLSLVWSNGYSGIRAKLKQSAPCKWEGFVTRFWDFPNQPEPKFPVRLECDDD